MDFLDTAVSKTKEVIDVACKKTTEVYETQKQKFDIASLENKKSKDFQALGEIYFNLIKDEPTEDMDVRELVIAIKEKNLKIQALKNDINAAKKKRTCPFCGAIIDDSSIYCNVCGQRVTIETDTSEAKESEETEETKTEE